MKVIVAGTRNSHVTTEDVISVFNEYGIDASEIVSGASGDADSAGERAAGILGVPKKTFMANWSLFGRAAGPIRNSEMADYADLLVAFWDGKSRGTKNMIEQMRKKGKEVIIIDV